MRCLHTLPIALPIVLFALPLCSQVPFDPASARRTFIENTPAQSGLTFHVDAPNNDIIVLVVEKPVSREFLQNAFSDPKLARDFWTHGFRALRFEAPGQQPWTRFLTSKGFSETDNQSVYEKALQNRYTFCAFVPTALNNSEILCGLTGDESDAINIRYPEATSEFAAKLFTPGFAKQLSEYGFSTLYISDGKGANWGAKVLADGFGQLDTGVTHAPASEAMGQSSAAAPAGSIKTREGMASLSTSISKQTGKNFVYSVCGSAQDILCVVDPNATVDGFPQRHLVDNQVNQTSAKGLADAGFTAISISDGRGSTWLLKVSKSGYESITPAMSKP
jgi:hypothetical protein